MCADWADLKPDAATIDVVLRFFVTTFFWLAIAG
jgi:hypothetical protein